MATKLVTALVSAALVAGGQAPAPQATFRATAERVAVGVAVTRAGRPVAGLAAADFDLRDNGVRQDVLDVSYEQLPIDVTVALDVSGSVSGTRLDQLRRAVRQLRGDLGARDRLRVIAFNMRVRQIADFAAPGSVADAAFDRLTAAGGTAILDTLATALAAPAPADRRQLIVLFSDGEDSSSITDVATLLDVARRTTPTVDVVLATASDFAARNARPEARAAFDAARETFAAIASETGGALTPLLPNEALPSAFRRALAQFRSTYLLSYAPQGVPRAGAHRLDVRVTRPGTFDVRARAGYVN